MPKGGMNEKAQAARERKAAQKDETNKAKAKAAEDAYWQAAGEGAKSKAQAKKDEQERQRAEAAAKKLEAKRLAEAEEVALVKPKTDKKAARVTGKVTHFELNKQKEADAAASEAQARERELATRREVTEDRYSRLVDTENTNREVDVVEARGMEQAIDALASLTTESPAADKHPEKRLRAAWKAYEEHNLPLLRMEKPNLKQSQYRDMLWRQWQKSPENPINQVAAAVGR